MWSSVHSDILSLFESPTKSKMLSAFSGGFRNLSAFEPRSDVHFNLFLDLSLDQLVFLFVKE